jgi:hypothetical protein
VSTQNVDKKKMGRPKVDSELLTARFVRADLDAIDAWSAAQPDTPSRPEALRRLVRLGLTSSS